MWIWSFSRRHWSKVLLYTLCGLFSNGMALLAGLISKHMIDAIIFMNMEWILLYGVCLAMSAVGSVALQSATSWVSARLSVQMKNDVQAKVFDDILAADWRSLSQYPTGDLLTRFSTDVDTVAGCAVSWLPGVIIQGFTILATLGIMVYYDPVLALICCASVPLMLLLSRSFLGKQREYNQKMRRVAGNLATFQSEAFRNIDTLKSFGVEQQTGEKLRFWQKIYRKTALEHNTFAIKTNIWMTLMGCVVQYGTLGYCLWRLWKGAIMFGTMTLFLQQRSSLSAAFSSFASLIPVALSGSVAAERIRELTQLPRETRKSPVELEGGCEVHLENIQVSYTQDRKVLSHVNMWVPRGKIVALIGPSGEGKTTLLRLMLGLIPPEAGHIYLQEGTGKQYHLGADTRHIIAYVPQGNTMIAGTIRENLLVACPEADEIRLRRALVDACAWEFVEKLPKQMDTPIGEGGKGLSEGQAQRVAIARALLKEAPILLLDEVTSALDRDTERRVLENLIRRQVTTVVTTHRPSILSQCVHAYRVKDGQVQLIEQEELIKLAKGEA